MVLIFSAFLAIPRIEARYVRGVWKKRVYVRVCVNVISERALSA